MQLAIHINRVLLLRIVLSVFSLVLILLALIAPLAQSLFNYPSGEFFYKLLNPICHQYPSRCLVLFEHPIALCTRCLFGYLGVFFASTFIVINKIYYKRLLIGLILLIVAISDPIIQLTTIYESNNFLRAISGLSGGMGFFFILNLFNKKRNPHEKKTFITLFNVFRSLRFDSRRDSNIT